MCFTHDFLSSSIDHPRRRTSSCMRYLPTLTRAQDHRQCDIGRGGTVVLSCGMWLFDGCVHRLAEKWALDSSFDENLRHGIRDNNHDDRGRTGVIAPCGAAPGPYNEARSPPTRGRSGHPDGRHRSRGIFMLSGDDLPFAIPIRPRILGIRCKELLICPDGPMSVARWEELIVFPIVPMIGASCNSTNVR